VRRTRRKPRVIWLPVHGRDFSNGTEGDVSNFANGIGGRLQVNPDGELYQDFQPLTFDYSDSANFEEGTEFRSLHELAEGNAYRLRRIVGKFHAGAVCGEQTGGGLEVPLLEVVAGFIVNRTDDDGNIQYVFPTAKQRGPLAQNAAEDPWIWRRKWYLSPVPSVANVALGLAGLNDNVRLLQAQFGDSPEYPQTTSHYGSVQDGPHIDQKTARVIGRQERLMFWVQARIANGGSAIADAELVWGLDVRILASLRTQVGNRRNASR